MTFPNSNLDVETIIQDLLTSRRIPTATYRFQFNAEFTLKDALRLVPYLHALGISDVYASPLFKPRSGSTHGYDIVDYQQLNPELGTTEDFEALISALKAHDMGLVLDFVPNHMGASTENPWWMDVLEHGMSSPYAEFFDIDWYLADRVQEKLLLPVLGDHYGRVLEAGEFRLTYEQERFWLYYWNARFPVTLNACESLLDLANEILHDDDHASLELASIRYALHALPEHDAVGQHTIRRREIAVIYGRIARLQRESAEFRNALASALQDFNEGESDQFDRLDAVIQRQPYRLAFWRVATDEINYRRFFDINDLAAVRIELPHVFEEAHRLLFQWIREGKVTGVRIDHPDGLWDPPGYFMKLQEGYIAAQAQQLADNPNIAEIVTGTLVTRFQQGGMMRELWPLYVLGEKILSEVEPLPEDWAVYGTTGYDFMVAVNGIFVERDQVHQFEQLYSQFIGRKIDFRELIYQMKILILTHSLASELNARGRQLARIAARNRRFSGFTRSGLTSALREIAACMTIYRTYIIGPGMISERDRYYLDLAVAEAKERNPRLPHASLDFVRDTLLMQNIYEFPETERASLIEFVMRFQQITGPVMAKSVEDTSFYIYNRLVSLNEVGGNPEQFGIGIDDFHKHNQWHQERWKHTMLALTTHDTKRSEDVRARLNLLSEIPTQWAAAIWRWREQNAYARTGDAPDHNDEYLIYQSLVGTLPFDGQVDETYIDRICNYMHKALNEAKVHTSWVNPNTTYDESVQNFVVHILKNAPFVADLAQFTQPIAFYGQFNSLSQTLLKLAAPGMPDTYQGTELWDFSLVDPDNRRRVDYEQRITLLNELQKQGDHDRKQVLQTLLNESHTGAIKLWCVQ